MEAGNATPQPEHGAFYWFCRNASKGVKAWVQRHKTVAAIVGVVAVYLIFLFRSDYQPLILNLRRNLYLLILGIPLLFILYKLYGGSARRKLGVVVAGLLIAAFVFFFGDKIQRYCALYYRYQTLNLVELDDLPETGHERIQPLNSVYSLAHENISESESPTLPHFVRIDGNYRWTLSIEPSYAIPRIFKGIRELISVPATTSAPNFSAQNRIPVHFDAGENLMLSHKTRTCVIRTFGLWRYMNYEPAKIIFIKNDENEWVQVVSLIRWRGIFFPRPEFGGVQVVRQQTPGLAPSLGRVLFGRGEWIPPKDIPKHPYLAGQSLQAADVSRNIAESFRFHNGFFAPMPGYHQGDIRIPDLPVDMNDQPFTTYFEALGEFKASLYHYFALEPFDPQRQGLNTSILVPADGSDTIYFFRHPGRIGSLTGVSAISAKVMETRKNYDWDRNKPVEHRPFIRIVGGRKRFFWLTTVVTFKEGNEGKFIAGSIPEVVLTDAAYNLPVWVNPILPNSWLPQLEKELSHAWSQEKPTPPAAALP